METTELPIINTIRSAYRGEMQNDWNAINDMMDDLMLSDLDAPALEAIANNAASGGVKYDRSPNGQRFAEGVLAALDGTPIDGRNAMTVRGHEFGTMIGAVLS